MMPNDSNGPSLHGLIATTPQPNRRDAIRLASAAATLLVCKPAATLGEDLTPAVEAVQPASSLSPEGLKRKAWRRRTMLATYNEWGRADVLYDVDLSLREPWDAHYATLIDFCEWELSSPFDASDDPEWRAWCHEILPPQALRRWQHWQQLTGLSSTYQSLNAELETKTRRYTDALSRCHPRCNTDNCPEHRNYWVLLYAAKAVLECPAVTLADREMRKHTIQLIQLIN